MSHASKRADITLRNFQSGDEDRIREITRAAWEGACRVHMIEQRFGQRGGKPWWHYKCASVLRSMRHTPECCLIVTVRQTAPLGAQECEVRRVGRDVGSDCGCQRSGSSSSI